MSKSKNKAKKIPVVVHPEAGRRTNRGWIVAVLVLHVILALIYWTNTPFGGSPDEGPHARYVEALVQDRGFPVYTEGTDLGYEFYQPPLYYALGAPFYLAGRALGIENPLDAVRLLSLILGGLSILVVYLAVARAFPEERRLAVTCAAFVALLPTHVMMSSSVSNDILMELIFGLFLLVAAQMLTGGFTTRNAIALGVVLGMGVLTKMTCMLLFPAALVVYLTGWKRCAMTCKTIGRHLITVALVSLALGGWWLVRNQGVYGDLLALQQMQAAFLSHSSKPDDFLASGMPPSVYLIKKVVVWTFDSFWGVLGHMDVFMPAWVYWMMALFSIASLTGLRRGMKELGKSAGIQVGLPIIYGVTLGLVLVTFLKLNTVVFQAQGRYLYPALVPISFFWMLGFRGLLSRSSNPAMYAGLAAPVLAQIMALATCVSK